MGTAELDNKQLTIYSHIITYGNAATPELSEMIREEIETMWNEPQGNLNWKDSLLPVGFPYNNFFSTRHQRY